MTYKSTMGDSRALYLFTVGVLLLVVANSEVRGGVVLETEVKEDVNVTSSELRDEVVTTTGSTRGGDGKQSKSAVAVAAGVLGSYLINVGKEVIARTKPPPTTRPPAPLIDPSVVDLYNQVNYFQQPPINPGGGFWKIPAPETPPPPTTEAIIPTMKPKPLLTDEQKLLALHYLQLLEQKRQQEEGAVQEVGGPHPAIATATVVPNPPPQVTESEYYEYDDELTTTTTTTTTTPAAPTRRRRRRTTTTPTTTPKPRPIVDVLYQQQLLQQHLIDSGKDYYDTDYLDPTPPPVRPTNPPLPPPPTTLDPVEYQQRLLQLQRLNYIMMLHRLHLLNQSRLHQQAEPVSTTESFLVKVPSIFLDPHIAPTRVTTTSENPDAVGNIAGFFGSLATGDLAGVVDSALKLGQSGVFDNLNEWQACRLGRDCSPSPGVEISGVDTNIPVLPPQRVPISIPPFRHPVQDRYPVRQG